MHQLQIVFLTLVALLEGFYCDDGGGGGVSFTVVLFIIPNLHNIFYYRIATAKTYSHRNRASTGVVW